MPEKHGVTGIIFDDSREERYFLLLHRVLNWKGWEFVKGGIDDTDATPKDAVLREILEETGLSDVSVVTMLPEKFAWIAKGTKYIYFPFLLKGDMSSIIDITQEVIEHDGYKWVPESEVEEMLTHADNKKIFRDAISLLDSMESK